MPWKPGKRIFWLCLINQFQEAMHGAFNDRGVEPMDCVVLIDSRQGTALQFGYQPLER